MFLSDLAVKRPVFAIVISLILVAFGALSFFSLPLREMPKMDAPVVSIRTTYTGASAEVVENKVTRVIEDGIAGIEGIDVIDSSSVDGRSDINVEFTLSRDIEAAANDIRDVLSRVAGRLPQEADPPEVRKQNASAMPVMFLSLYSSDMPLIELTDYADRYIKDRLTVVDGVANVWVSGSTYAMRIWIDRVALAARGLTVVDVERALRSENVELPAGRIENQSRDYSVRLEPSYHTADDFKNLVLARGEDGHLIRLKEVADVRLEAANKHFMFNGNGRPRVAFGIMSQSTANTLDVTQGVRQEVEKINQTLPKGMELSVSVDNSEFVKKAISEVYVTLIVAVSLVIFVIYLFLGTVRASIVPAVVIPVCLSGTFFILANFGMSINLMTLLALVLSIGLVVDDAIVVLENVQRRIDNGEPSLVAAFRGTRQVGFAVFATTLVLISSFAPMIFLKGFVGRIFGELAVTVSGAVAISCLVSLTLTAVMCSRLLVPRTELTGVAATSRGIIRKCRSWYIRMLTPVLDRPLVGIVTLVALIGLSVFFFMTLPNELAPDEDRGVFHITLRAAEGTSFDRMVQYAHDIESKLQKYVDSGEAKLVIMRVPGAFGGTETYNDARAIVVLSDWNKRKRTGLDIMNEVNKELSTYPGLRSFAYMFQAFQEGSGRPIQFVLSGSNYKELSDWSDILVAKARQNPGLLGVTTDYQPTKPQVVVEPDLNRTFDAGVSSENIGSTLQTMLGSRRVTTYMMNGQEYDVILQAQEQQRNDPSDLTNIFVRSDRTGKLIPLSNLVRVRKVGDVSSRNRFNRLRSITVSANLAPGYTQGEALRYLESVVKNDLPPGPRIDYKGASRKYKEQGQETIFAFGLALLIVFLVLAAQFESFIHPFIIILTVPMAISGAMLGLFLTGGTLNLYSEIGMIILVGIAAKNGILIVEFANQLRDQGRAFKEALLEAAETRFRPIIMTSLSTAFGAVPLILTTGPGSASRSTVGIVIFSGVILATLVTLVVVPIFYNLLARNTKSPGHIARLLSRYEEEAAPTRSASPHPAE